MTTPYSEPWEGKTRALTPDSSTPANFGAPPVKDVLDQELAAMRTIDVTLSRLDRSARTRVVTWASARVAALNTGLAKPSTPAGDTPWPTHTVDDIEPLSRDETDGLGPDYEWPTVSVYLGLVAPIRDSDGDEYTVALARKFAAELLSAAHRVETHDQKLAP
jgi:CelD/BcsL family acetyltransferase involved in cellulose biosynthesis